MALFGHHLSLKPAKVSEFAGSEASYSEEENLLWIHDAPLKQDFVDREFGEYFGNEASSCTFYTTVCP